MLKHSVRELEQDRAGTLKGIQPISTYSANYDPLRQRLIQILSGEQRSPAACLCRARG